MTTTDTIKALRDALTKIRAHASPSLEPEPSDPAKESIYRLADAALTADASEDAPDELAAFEYWMLTEAKCIIGSSDPYPAGLERQYRSLWKSARAARPAPVAATPAPDGWKLVPLEPDQRMIFAFLGEYHRPGGTERQCYRAMLAAAPAAPIGEVMPMPMRGGEVEPNAYDHLREQYESIFKGPGSMASWQRKQTMTGDVADEYVEMRVQFGWMAFQAGHRIASRHYAAEHAKPEPKFTPGKVAAHHHGESESNQALSIKTDQVDHQQVATSAPGIAHAKPEPVEQGIGLPATIANTGAAVAQSIANWNALPWARNNARDKPEPSALLFIQDATPVAHAKLAEGASLATVIAYLNGEGPLDGFHFGERNCTEPGSFWWRKHLMAAWRGQQAGAVDGEAE